MPKRGQHVSFGRQAAVFDDDISLPLYPIKADIKFGSIYFVVLTFSFYVGSYSLGGGEVHKISADVTY